MSEKTKIGKQKGRKMATVRILIIGIDNFLGDFVKNKSFDCDLLTSNAQGQINKKIKSLLDDKVDIVFLDTSLLNDPVKQFFVSLKNDYEEKRKNFKGSTYSPPPVFIVYDQSALHIRAEIWEQPIIGYAKKGSAEADADIKKILSEIVRRKAHEEEGKIAIGSIERIEPDTYERFKFVSLTAGRMREFMADFKSITDEIKDKIKTEDPFFKILPKDWFVYMNYSLHPPEDKETIEIWGNMANRMFDTVGVANNEQLQEKFKNIFCNENQVKSEKLQHILIEGETGTGKSLIAEMIRQFTKTAKFERVTCTNIPSNLLEGELFGHIRGSFTGSVETKTGRIVNAYNGIIFLDEIGDMDSHLQAKILTFLDNGRIEPIGWVGPTLYIPSLVVAATNKNLLMLAKAKKFREDLYYRFAQRITIPPLRERKGDIDLLVDFILQNSDINPFKGEERTVSHINKNAIEKLKTHIFPGNYRELEYILLEAVKKAKRVMSRVILPEDIVFHESSVEESDAVFVIPKKTEGDTVKILLQWDVNWKQYYFIGGRFERHQDVTLEDTARREIMRKIRIDSGYQLTSKSYELTSLQYPRQFSERRLYQFHFLGIKFDSTDVFDWLMKRDCILASFDDVARGDYKGRRISSTVMEVWEKLNSEISELPESFQEKER